MPSVSKQPYMKGPFRPTFTEQIEVNKKILITEFFTTFHEPEHPLHVLGLGPLFSHITVQLLLVFSSLKRWSP